MTNDEILKRLRDIAADRLAFLAQAIELAQNLTGPDDPKLEQLRNLIRSEGTQMPLIVEEMERMLADVKAVPPQDNTGKKLGGHRARHDPT